MTTRVLIVDDQAMIRVGLRAILEVVDGIEVVGDVPDGYAALRALENQRVDLVLLDLRMPGIDGVEVTRRIRARWGPDDVALIVLTTFDQDENVVAALSAGAGGFLGKGVTPAELVSGIREVAAGRGALSGAAAKTLIDRVNETPTRVPDAGLAARFDALTPREREIVIAIASGASNNEVAATFYLSPFTVKTHAARAMTKVGARDRAHLVALVYRAGIENLSRTPEN